MAKIYLTEYAEDQLAETEAHSLEFHPATTKKFMAAIGREIKRLSKDPLLGKNKEIHSARYLLHPTPNHYLVYEIIKGAGYIIAIEGKTRHIRRRLAERQDYFDRQVALLRQRLS